MRTGIFLLVLGGLLTFFTIMDKTLGLLRAFLILTGASAAVIPVSVVLHNAVYALFIHLLGGNFGERTGLQDEPVFFFLGLVICPVAFIAGSIGSIVLALKHHRASEKEAFNEAK